MDATKDVKTSSSEPPSKTNADKKNSLADVLLYGIILSIHYPLRLSMLTLDLSLAMTKRAVWLPLEILDRVSKIAQATFSFYAYETRVVVVYSLAFVSWSLLLPRKILGMAYVPVHGVVERVLEIFGRKSENPHKQNHLNEKIDGVRPEENQTQNSGRGVTEITDNVGGMVTSTYQKSKNFVTYYYNYASNEAQKYAQVFMEMLETIVKQTDALPLSSILKSVFSILGNVQNQTVSEKSHNDNSVSAKVQSESSSGELQSLQTQILALQQELKRCQNNSVDHERIQCNKQILDLEKELSELRGSFEKQNERLQSEISKQRKMYEDKVDGLEDELSKARVDHETYAREQISKFSRDRSRYLDDLERLLERTAQLRRELEKLEDDDDDEEEEDDDEEVQEYVNDALNRLDNVESILQDLEKEVSEFEGRSKWDEEYLDLVEKIIVGIMDADSVDDKAFSSIKRKRAQVEDRAATILSEVKSKC